MVAQGEAQGATSSNETLEDLNEESIPYLLARFYLAMTISNYVTDQNQRFQAVKLARAHLTQFIDDCMQYHLLSDQEVKLHAGELNEAKARDCRRQMLLDENKAAKAAQVALHELQSGTGKMDITDAYKALLVQAKF